MFEDLLQANRDYAAAFSLQGLLPRAEKGLGLVTCIDSRIEPLAALGLRPGDSKILRNAGGRVTDDVLRSLVLAVERLGVTRIVVMHHTHCALAGTSDEELRHALRDRAREATAGWQLLAMPDPDAALEADVQKLRECAALADSLAVEGWRYDVDTGLVARMVFGARGSLG